MASARPTTSGHMIQLDGLRAAAAIAVVAQHTLADRYQWGPLDDWQPRIGVRLFFVLSGFLITGILLKVRDRADAPGGSLKDAFRIFYARRLVRIFPLYYAVLFGATIAGLPGVRQAFLWHVSYLTNYYVYSVGSWPANLGHFWSLAVEEQFYLLWPAFLLLAPRRLFAPTFLALIIGSFLSYFLVLRFTANWVRASVITPSNLDALAIGGWLALIHKTGDLAWGRRFRQSALLAGAILGVASIALRATGRGWSVYLTLAQASNVLLFVWLVDGAARGFGGAAKRVLEFRPLTYLGTISYGIYVYHLLIPNLFDAIAALTGFSTAWPIEPGYLRFILTMAVSVAVAALSWHLFEKPINDLKRYFPYSTESRAHAPANPSAVEPSVSADVLGSRGLNRGES